jgi:type 1 fimbria pilin
MRTTIFAAVALMAITASALAAPGRCLLRVEGKNYIDGPCVITHGGGLTNGSWLIKSGKYAAQIDFGDGTVTGFAAFPGAGKYDLGTLKRDGDCFVSDDADRICASEK